MKLSQKDLERLHWIFVDYVESCDKSQGKFLDRILIELESECMKHGFKDSNNTLYCDVSDRFINQH
jgi:hypothetical protein